MVTWFESRPTRMDNTRPFILTDAAREKILAGFPTRGKGKRNGGILTVFDKVMSDHNFSVNCI